MYDYGILLSQSFLLRSCDDLILKLKRQLSECVHVLYTEHCGVTTKIHIVHYKQYLSASHPVNVFFFL